MNTDDRKWEIIESEYLIRRPWLTARRDRVKLPTGVEIPEYYILEYPDWVNVIAITKEGKFVLASGTTTDKQSTKICKFLGDISYPVYVVHYPLMYLFYAWLIENKLYTLGETWYVAVGVFVLSVILACLCLKLYDEPVRKWLSKKFLAPK